jgi:hypothetical protein
MDRALQLALRDYAISESDEDAQRVARLLLRSRSDSWEEIPSKSEYGYLTHAGLLRALSDLTDEQLADDISYYTSEGEQYSSATDFFTNDDFTDVLDTGHGMLLEITCDACGSPFDSERAERHFTEPDLDDFCDDCPNL